MRKPNLRQMVVILALLAMLTVNGLANALPLNGQTTGAVSDRFEVYFVPAGYVFSIWGVIYLALILFAIYQALPGQRDNPRLEQMGYLFALSCLANIAWLFLWHYERFVWTLVAMGSLLVLLIVIYLRLDIGRGHPSTAERWLVQIPFSLYLGWITVATIANVTSVLDYLNWDGWGISPETWTMIMLGVGTGIGAAVGFTRHDTAYLLVLIWAFVGIGVKHAGVPIVATAAWIAAALVALVLIANVVQQRRSRPAISFG